MLGIDSVMQPFEYRVRAWQRIATDLPLEKFDAMIQLACLSKTVRGTFSCPPVVRASTQPTLLFPRLCGSNQSVDF